MERLKYQARNTERCDQDVDLECYFSTETKMTRQLATGNSIIGSLDNKTILACVVAPHQLLIRCSVTHVVNGTQLAMPHSTAKKVQHLPTHVHMFRTQQNLGILHLLHGLIFHNLTLEIDPHWPHLDIMLVASVVALVSSRHKVVQTGYMPSSKRLCLVFLFLCFWEFNAAEEAGNNREIRCAPPPCHSTCFLLLATCLQSSSYACTDIA